MSDDPNSVGSTREAYVPISQDELSWLLHMYSVRSTARFVLLELVDQRRDRVTLQKENAELRGQLDLLTKVNAEEAAPEEDFDPVIGQLQVLFERLHYADKRADVQRERLDGALRTMEHLTTALQHHASLIAGLGREAVETAIEDTTALADGPGGPEFPPMRTEMHVFRQNEELVLDAVDLGGALLERGMIVMVKPGTKSGSGTLEFRRDWEIVGLSLAAEGAKVQLAVYPWADGSRSRPIYWVSVDDIVSARAG